MTDLNRAQRLASFLFKLWWKRIAAFPNEPMTKDAQALHDDILSKLTVKKDDSDS